MKLLNKAILSAFAVLILPFSIKAGKEKPAPKTPDQLSACKNKKQAKKLIKRANYAEALKYLKAGAAKKPNKKFFPAEIVNAETKLRDYKAANEWYKKLDFADSSKIKCSCCMLNYAITQKQLEQYEEAEKTFTKVLKSGKKKDNDYMAELKRKAKREIEGCRKAYYFRDSVLKPDFNINIVGENINQPFSDFAPVHKSEDVVYFTSLSSDKLIPVKKSKDIFEQRSKIYKSVNIGGKWTKAEPLPENINISNVHIANPAFTPDGKTMYFNHCEQDKNARMKCDIYFSRLEDGIWQNAADAGLVNDELYTSAQPAIGKNKDGELGVYFVSDRNEAKGLDIYFASFLEGGKLSKPRSLGSQVNSRLDEVSPFFDFNSNTLYFSSKGWPTVGGFDVFKTSWDNGGEWLEPQNLGFPVNSGADDRDFKLRADGIKGFMVSNRPGGYSQICETCSDDIYEVQTTRISLAVTGKVYEETASGPMLASFGSVLLYDEKTKEDLDNYALINGQYFFDLAPGNNYKLISQKSGFYDAQIAVSTEDRKKTDTLMIDLLLKRKKTINPLTGTRIGSVYHDYNMIVSPNIDTLTMVEQFLRSNPTLVIEIGSHTDNKGSAQYNRELSEKRANDLLNYFLKKGFDKNRFVVRGYGFTKPVMRNTKLDGSDNPEGRAKNRRTEFTVIDELK